MFGVEILFTDGSKDWIDPVEDEPINNNGKFIVANTSHTYEYDLNCVDKWIKYELCGICGHDVRTYECTEDECMKP